MTSLQPQEHEQPTSPERAPMLPPTEGLPAESAPDIKASRGIGNRILKRIGFDDQSLDEAGVLRAHDAHAAEDAARGISQPSNLPSTARERANQVAATPEYIEPINKHNL